MPVATHVASASSDNSDAAIGAGHTIDVVVPAGVQIGDVLIAVCVQTSLDGTPVQPAVDFHTGGFADGWFFLTSPDIAANLTDQTSYYPFGDADSVTGKAPWLWYRYADGTESATTLSLGFCDPLDDTFPSKAAYAVFGVSIFRDALVPQFLPYQGTYNRDYNYAGAFPAVFEGYYARSGIDFAVVAVTGTPPAITQPAGWTKLYQATNAAKATAIVAIRHVTAFAGPVLFVTSVGTRSWCTHWTFLEDLDLAPEGGHVSVMGGGASAGQTLPMLAPFPSVSRRNPTIVPPISQLRSPPNRPWRPTMPISEPDRMPDVIEERRP